MDEDMLKIKYKTLIKPHDEYANCIWRQSSRKIAKDADLVEKVQRRATKLVREMTYN